uniref:SKA complex subunit 1 n=1 Tax=Zosterops lateralis melanops TaxID=1220523 RepID=A0A8D2P513_ZOSLA
MKDTASSSLEDLCFHINEKISDIKKCILVRDIGKQDQHHKSVLCKIQNEVILVHELLNKMETEVKQQEKLRDLLKWNSPSYLHALYILNIPSFYSVTVPAVKDEGQTKPVEPKHAKKPAKETKVIKEAALITTEEFQSVPTYMKGRITYDQINAVVQQINKAVVDKYKILYQPLKSMSVPARNLYHRFMEEETKDTKGVFFIVEADIKEFTQLKLDKRFHNILNILRHCQRVREIRGSGLIRYVIC